MRGVSVSVEYIPSESSSISSMEMEILSQGLRKAKAASIWTSDLGAIEKFAKEQSAAKGDFPGPCPVIYNGNVGDVKEAISRGATAIVLDASSVCSFEANSVDIICKVESVEEIHQAVESGFEYAFLISGSGCSDDELRTMLNAIPKTAVVVASLPSMQVGSQEIARGKELSTISSESAKVGALLIDEACVGDSEDLKYTAFVVENINKKSSSTFKMTGLTGSANGHFGSGVSGGLPSSKWRRMEHR